MLTRFLTVTAGLVALGVAQPTRANPVTYQFTGRLQNPYNGATQFSGSFTYNDSPPTGDLPPYVLQYGWPVSETGSDVSFNLSMGGQTYHFVNTPANSTNFPPLVSAGAGLASSTELSSPIRPVDEFTVGVTTLAQNTDGRSLDISLMFYSPAIASWDSHRAGPAWVPAPFDLKNFQFLAYTGSIFVSDQRNGTYYASLGDITSIEQVTTPEPGTLNTHIPHPSERV
jgi:hypothetical protein